MSGIIFSGVTKVVIPEGEVIRIKKDDLILWEKTAQLSTYIKLVTDSEGNITVYLRGTAATGYTEYTGGYITGSPTDNAKVVSVITESPIVLPENLSAMFRDTTSLTSTFSTSDWDTSNATSLIGTFYNSAIPSIDLSSWDTSNVTSMMGMFQFSPSLTSVTLDNLDTSNVTSMGNMFYGCTALSSLDIDSWDVSAVTDMQSMFYQCSSLTSLDLSGWDVSAVNNMRAMFAEGGFTSLDLYRWDTSAVTNMYMMFAINPSLEHIYVGNNWSTASVSNSTNMFSGDTVLHNFDSTYLDKTKAIIDDGSNGGYLELNVTGTYRKLSDDGKTLYLRGNAAEGYTQYNYGYITGSLDGNKAITSVVVENNCLLPQYFYSSFAYCESLTSLDLSNFDTSNVIQMNGSFSGCTSLESLNVSNFNTSNVTIMQEMFRNCKSLTSLDLSSFNTSNVTTMGSMFYNCQSLTSLNVSSFDTSNVTQMLSMFNECSSLTSLDVSSFNTSNVTQMNGMFYNCQSLTSLNVSNFDTLEVTNMNGMFGAEVGKTMKLTSLDLSSFNTSKVTSMNSMFASCTNLQHIYVGSGWNTDLVTSSTQMFTYDTALHNFNWSYIDKTKAIIDDGTNGGYLEELT